MKTNFFKTYLLPGITFQSIVIAGGYGTGQEINQYFLSLGPTNGLYGLLVTMMIWSIICSLCFVLAKTFEVFDYKAFFKVLLGKGWFLFEICYLYLVIIVLSIVSASVGTMLQELLGIPYSIGLLLPLCYILFMVIKGNQFIEKMFTFWSFLLYGVFIAFFWCCFKHFDVGFLKEVKCLPEGSTWLKNGVSYASYNLGCLPAILFSLRYLKNKKSAVVSGLLVGPIACIPAILLYLALLTNYPRVLEATIPSTHVLQELANPTLTLAFSIVLMGTLIETGVGLVHAFNERIKLSQSSQGANVKNRRITLIVILLGLAFGLSQFGLVKLIAQGYTVLTWAILSVFILPLLTLGFFKIKNSALVCKPTL